MPNTKVFLKKILIDENQQFFLGAAMLVIEKKFHFGNCIFFLKKQICDGFSENFLKSIRFVETISIFS